MSNSTNTTTAQTTVSFYTPLSVPAAPAGYTKNYGAQTNNLVAWTATLKSQLDDAIYISKNANAAAGADPYLWNHWVQFSTDNTPSATQTL